MIDFDDELVERLAEHLAEHEPLERFVEALVNIYEQKGRFTDQGR